MKLFSKLNLLTLVLGGTLVLSVPMVKADTTNQQSTATLNIQDESTDTTAKLSLDEVPSFPFNNVKAGTIFSGQSVDQGLTNNNHVVVTDTRLMTIWRKSPYFSEGMDSLSLGLVESYFLYALYFWSLIYLSTTSLLMLPREPR